MGFSVFLFLQLLGFTICFDMGLIMMFADGTHI